MTDRLYHLLPAIYRHHDESQGYQLKAYMRVLESQLETLERDTRRMYDNHFVETCEPWVLPYLGELVGLDPKTFANLDLRGQRARVGNATAYVRRKGTHAAMEKVIAAATGWGARVVVNQKQLNTTQHLAAPLPDKGRLVDLRGGESTWLGTSFEQSSRSVDVRQTRIGPNGAGLGGNQPMNVGIHLWRVKSYFLTRTQPHCLDTPLTVVRTAKNNQKADREVAPAEHSGHYYTVSPLGNDMPMFKFPVPWRDNAREADIGTLPGPLFRNPIEGADEDYRAALARGERLLDETVFRATHYVVYLRKPSTANETAENDRVPDDVFEKVPMEHVLNTSLDPWPAPEALPTRTPNGYRSTADGMEDADTLVTFPVKVLVDVTNGRLAFPTPVNPEDVRVDYAYGFAGELGGGPYHRTHGVLPMDRIEAFVSRACKPDPPNGRFNSLSAAMAYPGPGVPEGATREGLYKVIRILDNATYRLPKTTCPLRDNRHLIVEAANGRRPCLKGDFQLELSSGGGSLTLSGLLLDGSIKMVGTTPQAACRITLVHTTIVPDPNRASLVLGQIEDDPFVRLDLSYAVVGRLNLGSDLVRLDAQDSIIHGDITGSSGKKRTAGFSVAAFQRCTVLGQVRLRELALARDTLFTQSVEVVQRKSGQVRFCYYTQDSVLPATFACRTGPEYLPQFVSTAFGHEAYCRLSQACSEHIMRGAEDGGEMGAYHHTDQGRREAALHRVLEEFLPFGLKAEVRFLS